MELSDHQREVSRFIEDNNLGAAPGFRVLDLVSEVGELVQDVTKSSDYGLEPEKMDVKKDEVGDVLFSLLAVCNELDIDAEEALEEAVEKYESRIEQKGEPGSE